MTNDTQNSLTDFDMCLALAQMAINSQMAAAWESWIARSDLSNTSEMKDFALVSIYDNEFKTSGLEVEFDPLTVSLYVPNGKLGQVQVTLHLKSGTVFSEKVNLTRSERRETDNAVEDMIAEAVKKGEISSTESKNDSVFDKYTAEYKKRNPEKFKQGTPISNWSISFLTDLEKKPCDLKVLEKIDPKAYEAASKCIQDSPLPDSVFSIEYLFMKFTEVDLLLSDNKDIQLPPDVPKAAVDKVKSCLNTLLQGNGGEFMLGTVVRRSKTRSEGHPIPTFGLTDFAFHVKADEYVPESSTLSYLGMFSKRPLPKGKDLDSARLKLGDNWVRPEMLDGTKGSIAGTMAISKQVFMDQYLIPVVTKNLNLGQPSQSSDGLTWTYTSTYPETIEHQDIVRRVYELQRTGEVSFSVLKGDHRIRVSGQVRSSVSYKSYGAVGLAGGLIGLAAQAIINATKGQRWNLEATMDIVGHQDIQADVILNGTGGLSNFKLSVEIEPANESYASPATIDSKKLWGTIEISEGFFGDEIVGPLFNFLGLNSGRTPNDLVTATNKKLLDDLSKSINEGINNIKVDLNQNAFIPPGGGILTFQNLRFSDAGDLLFDVIYKAP